MTGRALAWISKGVEEIQTGDGFGIPPFKKRRVGQPAKSRKRSARIQIEPNDLHEKAEAAVPTWFLLVPTKIPTLAQRTR